MQDKLEEDTIVAIATPPGIGAISVIRVSGSQAISSVAKIFVGKKRLEDAESHTIHYGEIVNSLSEIIDDVLVSVFKKPNSYTGEDSVEISTHGNPLIAQKIIDLLISDTVRLAEPGEFTKRAFLNNRIDLSQAEAVVDVIHSRTEVSLRGSRNQLNGLLSAKVKDLREMLISASSFIELELDFAEEDLEFINKNQLEIKIAEIVKELDALISTFSFGKLLRDGINLTIVGEPNVGKSSLMNYILKESRAIVSNIPGTTRDVIREEVSIDGILFKIFDTAGIRKYADEIEKEGVSRSRKAIKDSDLIVFLGDVEKKFSPVINKELTELSEIKQIIKVLNKIDLIPESNIIADIKISAKTGEGIKSLLNLLKEKALGNTAYSESTAIVSNTRHFKCLKNAKISLMNAVESLKGNMSGEFISLDLRKAEKDLAEIIGEVINEDILNNIFSKFCIGK